MVDPDRGVVHKLYRELPKVAHVEYTTLGSTGMKVSRICLGGMSLGSSQWREFVLDEPESRAIIEHAIDRGINFFDTGNYYSNGESERVLGKVINEYGRDRFVINTKVYPQMDEHNPNSGGLSRKAIELELGNSLDRLDTDYIDLYQVHKWDETTPIAETLWTLDHAVHRREVLYIGASKMRAYQLATALHTSDRLALERFATMQSHYNLVYREEERELHPLCSQEGLGVLTWSPLARGYLTRPYDEFESTKRGKTDPKVSNFLYEQGGGREINVRVQELAEEKGLTMAQVALAWQLHKEPVTAPVVGVTDVEHIDQAIESLEVTLTESETQYLEEPYEAVPLAEPSITNGGG